MNHETHEKTRKRTAASGKSFPPACFVVSHRYVSASTPAMPLSPDMHTLAGFLFSGDEGMK